VKWAIWSLSHEESGERASDVFKTVIKVRYRKKNIQGRVAVHLEKSGKGESRGQHGVAAQ